MLRGVVPSVTGGRACPIVQKKAATFAPTTQRVAGVAHGTRFGRKLF